MSSAKRRTYILICKFAVEELPLDLMNKYFTELFIELSKDPNAQVRKDFALSLQTMKPCFEEDVDRFLQLSDILSSLMGDEHPAVVEAAEHTDYLLLQQRKKQKTQQSEKGRSNKEK